MKKKLSTKELILAGAFGAIFVVGLIAMAVITGFTPITFLMVAFLTGIVLGPIYMLYINKVPKRGAILILAALCGLVMSSTSFYPLLFSLLCGLAAEVTSGLGNFESPKHNVLGYSFFSSMFVGPFLSILFAKEAFFKSMTQYYGEAYVANFASLAPEGIILGLILSGFIGGLIGGVLGNKALKHHFKRAGIV